MSKDTMWFVGYMLHNYGAGNYMYSQV